MRSTCCKRDNAYTKTRYNFLSARIIFLWRIILENSTGAIPREKQPPNRIMPIQMEYKTYNPQIDVCIQYKKKKIDEFTFHA